MSVFSVLLWSVKICFVFVGVGCCFLFWIRELPVVIVFNMIAFAARAGALPRQERACE